MTTQVQAASAAQVNATEAPAAPAKAQWINPISTWSYDATASVFNAPNEVENCVAYTAAKAVCAVASAFVAIAQTIAYIALSVVNGAIHTLNAGHRYFNPAEEAPAPAAAPVAAEPAVTAEAPAQVEADAEVAASEKSEEEEETAELPDDRGYLRMFGDFVANHGGSRTVEALKNGKTATVDFVKGHKVGVATGSAAATSGATAAYFSGKILGLSSYTTGLTGWAATGATAATGLVGAALVGGAAYLVANRMVATKA